MGQAYDERAYAFGMRSEDFRRASVETWEEMARGWDDRRDAVWDDSGGIGAWLVAALDPQPGETVLELAAGLGDTGYAAGTRLGERGRLICTDFSAPMVDAARRRARERGVTNAEFRTMDAERIDLADDSVDGVLCRWGYMLMADPAKALRETRRVLRKDGRLALSVWSVPERNPWAAVPARALLEHTGEPPPDPLAPGIFAMARDSRTRELLEDAGFQAERVEEVAMTWRFDSVDDYWRFVLDVAGALAMVIRSLPADRQEAVRQRVERDLEPFATANGYELGGVCLNVLAR
jgi:ubiquinone/menaquinone biosynthesis C-methylase UbiE